MDDQTRRNWTCKIQDSDLLTENTLTSACTQDSNKIPNDTHEFGVQLSNRTSDTDVWPNRNWRI